MSSAPRRLRHDLLALAVTAALCAAPAGAGVPAAPRPGTDGRPGLALSAAQDQLLDAVFAAEESPESSTWAAEQLARHPLEAGPRARALAALHGAEPNLRWLLTRSLESTRTPDVAEAALARMADAELDSWSRRAAAAAVFALGPSGPAADRAIAILRRGGERDGAARAMAVELAAAAAAPWVAAADREPLVAAVRELAAGAETPHGVRLECLRALGPADVAILAAVAADARADAQHRLVAVDRLDLLGGFHVDVDAVALAWSDPAHLEERLRRDPSREFREALALWVRARAVRAGDEHLRARADEVLSAAGHLAFTQERPLGR